MHSHARTSAKIDATLSYVAIFFVLFLSPEIARRSSQKNFRLFLPCQISNRRRLRFLFLFAAVGESLRSLRFLLFEESALAGGGRNQHARRGFDAAQYRRGAIKIGQAGAVESAVLSGEPAPKAFGAEDSAAYSW